MLVNLFTSMRHSHVSPLPGLPCLPWLLCIVLFWLAAMPLVHAQATVLEALPSRTAWPLDGRAQ